MSIVPSRAPPDMKQVALGAFVEVLGVLIALGPGLVTHGDVRLTMPWAAVGAVVVAVGGWISLKAILAARRAGA